MIRTIRLFETDSSKQMKKRTSWMNESETATRNTHRLNQNEEDFEAYHSIKTICWFLTYYDSISFQEIWFNMMRIAEHTISISYRLELIQPWAKRSEAMNMQSISRDFYEIRYTALNQSDWNEKRKIFERVRTLCFRIIRDTTQKESLLKRLLINKCWRMCSRECEWLCKNTKQSKTKRQDY